MNLRKTCAWMAISLLVLLGAGRSGPRRPAPDSTLGAYQIELRGGFSGRGNLTVTPNLVNVQAMVRDDAGNTSNLVAPALPLENGRFDGSGSISGLPVRIMGRVDPPSDLVPVARVTLMVTRSDGMSCRGIASKK
jgi:hypothetical protein